MASLGSVTTALLEQQLTQIDGILTQNRAQAALLTDDQVQLMSEWNLHFQREISLLPLTPNTIRINELFKKCVEKSSMLGLAEFNTSRIYIPLMINLETLCTRYETLPETTQNKVIEGLNSLRALFHHLHDQGKFDLDDPVNIALMNRYDQLYNITKGPGLVSRALSYGSSYLPAVAGLYFSSPIPAVALSAAIEFTKSVTAVRSESKWAITRKTVKAACGGFVAHHTAKAVMGDLDALAERSTLRNAGIIGGIFGAINSGNLKGSWEGFRQGFKGPIIGALMLQGYKYFTG